MACFSQFIGTSLTVSGFGLAACFSLMCRLFQRSVLPVSMVTSYERGSSRVPEMVPFSHLPVSFCTYTAVSLSVEGVPEHLDRDTSFEFLVCASAVGTLYL